jgi:hypothetical protein
LHIVITLKFSVCFCAFVVVRVGLFGEADEVLVIDKLIYAVNDVDLLHHFLFFFF